MASSGAGSDQISMEADSERSGRKRKREELEEDSDADGDFEASDDETGDAPEDDDGDDDFEDDAAASKAKSAKKPAKKKKKVVTKTGTKAKATKGKSKTGAKSKARKSPAKKTKAKATKKSPARGKGKKSASKGAKVVARTGKVKELSDLKILDLAMQSHRWWEEPEPPEGTHWTTMEHAGVIFPPEYEPHGLPVYYEGEPVQLSPVQEEMATLYAHCLYTNVQQLQREDTAKVFRKNFWKDWSKALGRDHQIRDLQKVDFKDIVKRFERIKEEKDALTRAEKEAAKVDKSALQIKHGYAIVDGHLQKMGNYMCEPPNLFRGRGVHPKMGTMKRRVEPEQITLNLSPEAVVPPCPMPGRQWGRIVHDPSVTWLAFWRENVMGGTKYMYLAASSGFKGKSDMQKYEKARKLARIIGRVRSHYERLLDSEDKFEQQCGSAMWIIDRLALRVGGEKDDDEADTVGCCSLRVEHIQFSEDGGPRAPKMDGEEVYYDAVPDDEEEDDDDEPKAAGGGGGASSSSSSSSAAAAGGGGGEEKQYAITFDFLGKDSMRFFQTLDIGRYGRIGRKVYENIRSFCRGKRPQEDVFDELNPTKLNDELHKLMPGLSAKVFRTYNASITLEREICDMKPWATANDMKVEYDRANKKVAILCNHQRSVPKSFEKSLAKMQAGLMLLKKQLKELKSMRTQVKKGTNIKLKDSSLPRWAKKTSELTEKQKEKRQAESHLFGQQPSPETVTRRIKSFEDRIRKRELAVKNKDDTKNVSLSTSKINYMDPRVTVAWCKRNNCPIEKVFPQTLRDKFPWAMGASKTYRF